MKMMIATHITLFIFLSGVSWLALKGLEVLTGNIHANDTIFLTTLIVSFFIMFTGYSNEEEGDDE